MKNKRMNTPINNAQEVQTKGKNVKVLLISVCLAIALLAAATVAVYAWFTSAFEVPGAVVETGKINLGFSSYRIDDQTNSLMRYVNVTSVNPGSIALLSAAQSDVGICAGDTDGDNTYFILEKKADSIPLDVRFVFSLLGLTDASNNYQLDPNHIVTYAGGYTYEFREITTDVMPYIGATGLSEVQYLNNSAWQTTPAVSSIEQALYAYASANAVPAGTARELMNVNTPNAENESQTLRTAQYSVFCLTVSLKDACAGNPIYADQKFTINLSLMSAQEEGLLSQGTTRTYHVSTDAQLGYALDVYSPGDSIVIDDSFTFSGDLVFNKPVSLYLNYNGGKCLTVNGNLVFSYPYEDTYTVNTQNNGQIKVLSTNGVGGNFRIDVPNGNVVLTGENNTAVGKADYYVSGDILWNASCIPYGCYDSGDAGYGVTLERVWMLKGTGASDENQVKHEIYLFDNTQLTVAADTTVGKIFPVTASGTAASDVRRIVIVNYGIIAEDITLTQTDIVGTSYNDAFGSPQIFIDNYNIISRAISLPLQAKKYQAASNTGNTRIVQELGAQSMTIAQNGAYFVTADIEVKSITERVVNLSSDGTDLLVYYAELASDNGVTPTLESILEAHITRYTNDGDQDTFNTQNKTQIKKLKVITVGGLSLTSADYAYLKQMTNIEELDLSEADAASGSVPADAFKNLSSLWNLSLPSNTVSIGDNAVVGTQVVDLSLPATCTTLSSKALDGVKAVHVNRVSAVITSGLQKDSSGNYRYLFLCNSTLYNTYLAHSTYKNYPQYLFRDATYQRGSQIYYRYISATEAEIACYVGEDLQHAYSPELGQTDFGFESVRHNGVDYKIVGIDDYAFYNKLLALNGFAGINAAVSADLKTVGKYAFYNAGALTGPLSFGTNLESIGTYGYYGAGISSVIIEGNPILGDYVFGGCPNLVTVTAPELLVVPRYGFSDCTSLLKAVMVKAELKAYAFSGCTHLAVLETTLFYGESQMRLLTNCKNIKLWILHSETSDANTPYYLTYTLQGHTGLWSPVAGCECNLSLRIMMNENTANTKNLNYYGTYLGSTDYYRSAIFNGIASSGQFIPTQYRYADDADSTRHATYTGNDGQPHLLSELGYGDYIYAIDGENNAHLLSCLSDGITGAYSVPATFENASGTACPVVEITPRAYFQVNMTNVTLTLPATLQTIGAGAFQNADLVGTVEGGEVTSIGTHGFYNNPSLLKAVFPKATLSSYTFAQCTHLAVLETTVYYGSSYWRTLDNCKNLKLWILHTEYGTNDNIYGYTYADHTTGLYSSSSTSIRSGYRLVFSENTSNLYGKNYYALANTGYTDSNYYSICSSGAFLPSSYRYADDADSTRHATYTGPDEQPHLLSELGYGDYIYAIDENNKAHLINCLSDSITGAYSVPATFENDAGIDCPVVELTARAFFRVDMTNVTLTLPATLQTVGAGAFQARDVVGTVEGSGVTSIGNYAFYKCTSILKAVFPCAALNALSFGSCTHLAALETTLYYGAYRLYSLDNCVNLKLWICHTETSTSEAPYGYTYNCDSNGYYNSTRPRSNMRILISESTNNAKGYDYFSKTYSSYTDSSKYPICSSGQFIPTQYLYVDDPDSTRHATYTGLDGQPHLMSELGYGDYIYGIDASNKATLIHCLSDSITGAYSIPATLEDANGVARPVVEVCTRAYRHVTMTNVALTVPATVTALGNDTFNARGLVGALDLQNVTSVGRYTFYQCTGLTGVVGNEVTEVNSYAFYGCSSLLTAYVPKASLVNYAFANCSHLAVLETCVYSKGYGHFVVNNSLNLRLWILHPEYSSVNSVDGCTYIIYNGQYSAVADGAANTPTDFVIVVSESTANAAAKNYFSLICTSYNSTTYTHLCSSGQFLPASYRYANETDNTRRATYVGNDGEAHYFSELGYGDYIYATDADGAHLICCLSDSITGAYTLPATFENDSHVQVPVVGITTRALHRPQLTGITMTLPTTLKYIGANTFNGARIAISGQNLPSLESIGQDCFSGNTLLSGTFNCPALTAIGQYAFKGCTGIEYFEGPEVLTMQEGVFYECTSLLKVYTPKSTWGAYTFYHCTHLVAVETTHSPLGNQANMSLEGCTNLLLWIIHPEYARSSSYAQFAYTVRNSYMTTGMYKTEAMNPNFVMLISEQGCYGGSFNYFTIINKDINGDTYYPMTSTGLFLPDEYLYADATELPANVVRRSYVDNEGHTKYLSDIGYGDYVFALNGDGTATLVTCLLKEVKNNYVTPATFTYEDTPSHNVTVPVNAIGTWAYSQTSFSTASSVTVSEGVTTVGARAFYTNYTTLYKRETISLILPTTVTSLNSLCFKTMTKVQSLTVQNESAVVTATNIFSDATGFTPPIAAFKIYVPSALYASYTTSARWGNIPKAYFSALDAMYQPVAGGPIFYFMACSDGYRLTNVENVTASLATLQIPTAYYKNGTYQGDVREISYNAFNTISGNTTITALILPDNLYRLETASLILPRGIQTIQIATSNTNFETDGGVLYDKGKTALLLYPAAKADASFTLPASVVAINRGAFRNVSALTAVTGTAEGTFSGYLFVSSGAFENCAALSSVTFGRSVVLASNAFTSCSALTDVTYLGTQPTVLLTPDPFDGRSVTVH